MNEDQNKNQLPKDWKWEKLWEVGKIETGTTPSKNNSEYYGKEIPFFKPTDLQQGINTIIASDNLSKLGFEKTRKLPKDSILVTCIGATIGKTGLIKVEGASNQQINSIIPDKLHNPKFVFYQIISHSFQNQIKDNASSTTLPILNKSKFQQLDFITTTFDSQQVVVSKIEELFSELDKGIENLRIAQQQLKTYRQSVLKWAFEGKSRASITFSEIVNSYQNGISKRSATEGNPFKVLRLADIRDGEINSREPREIKLVKSEIEKYKLNDNDIIAIRVNGSKDLVGRFVLVNAKDEWAFCDHFIRIRLNTKRVLPKLIKYYAESRTVRRFIELNMVSSAGQNTISQTTLSLLEVKLPSIEEQNKIVQEIESRLSVADKMEESITQSLQQSEALKQSILKKAFEGNLI